MSINAYLNFPGNTREVVNFYAEVFNQPLQKSLRLAICRKTLI